MPIRVELKATDGVDSDGPSERDTRDASLIIPFSVHLLSPL